MALVNLETYYSFPNLSDENNVSDILPVSLKSSGEATRMTQRDKDNGSKFKFQKAVTISLILQKQ